MTYIYFFLFIVGFLILLVFFQLIFGILRARYFGVRLTFNESFYLIKNYNLKSDFLKGYAAVNSIRPLDLKEAFGLYSTGLDLHQLASELKDPANFEKEINVIVSKLLSRL